MCDVARGASRWRVASHRPCEGAPLNCWLLKLYLVARWLRLSDSNSNTYYMCSRSMCASLLALGTLSRTVLRTCTYACL